MKKSIFFWTLMFGGILLCHDGYSQAWKPQADSLFGAYWNVKALDAVNDKVAWAGLNYTFESSAPTVRPWYIRTTDGGSNWQYDTIPGTAGYVFNGLCALNADTAWVSLGYAADAAKNRIYYTNDGGQSWKLRLQDKTAKFILHFFDSQNGIIVDDNRFRHTSDGGNTWSLTDTFATSDTLLSSVLYLNPAEGYDLAGDTMWIAMLDGLVRSTNKGKTWSVISNAGDSLGFAFAPFNFADGRNGMGILEEPKFDAAGEYTGSVTKIYRTTDGGVTWRVQPAEGLLNSSIELYAFMLALESVKGAPNTYILPITTYAEEQTELTLITKDNGSSWDLLPDQPIINQGTVEFTSPTSGWIGGFLPFEKAGEACMLKWEGPLNPLVAPPVEKIKQPIATNYFGNVSTIRNRRNLLLLKKQFAERKASGQ
jgi:hypothetical protein